VTTERILSKEQTSEMGYLRRVLGVTLHDKEHRSDIGKARDVKPNGVAKGGRGIWAALSGGQHFAYPK